MAAFTLPVFYIWYLIIIGQETSAYDKPFRRNNIPVFIANQLTEGYYYLRNANETNRIVKLTKNTELTNSEYDGPDVDFSDPVSLQPCTQHDTCRGRCIEHQEEPEAVAEVAHFNCYCDSECEIFRDCCWDYYEYCSLFMNEPRDDAEESENHQQETQFLQPHFEAFECIVVDQFSKDYFWVITKCARAWPDDDIKKKCTWPEPDFITLLPVQGDTGWTYRNAFCAQCNYVLNFRYWSLSAKCLQSAPDDVLNGDSEMISYYLIHFCNIQLQLQRDFTPEINTTVSEANTRLDEEGEDDVTKLGLEDINFKKPLRRCENNLVKSCPSLYDDDFVEMLCEDYQSTIIHREIVNEKMERSIFKNPMCAYCHGVNIPVEFPEHQPTVKPQGEIQPRSDARLFLQDLLYFEWAGSHTIKYPALECPVWLFKVDYDIPFWSISVSSESRHMLPSFSQANMMKSKWTPPSFSMLFQFRKDGNSNIDYIAEGGGSTSIQPKDTCSSGEIYDPFYGRCRPVICQYDYIYTDNACKEPPTQTSTTEMHSHYEGKNSTRYPPTIVTVTVTLEIPINNHMNHSHINSLKKPIENLDPMYFENAFNSTVVNITVLNFTIIEIEHPENETANYFSDEESLQVVFSFVAVEPGDYSDEEIIEAANYLNSLVVFKKLLMEADFLTVLVLSTPKVGNMPLVCMDGTKEKQYGGDTYEIIECEGRNIVHVNSTDGYYLEGEYEFLDWKIEINDNGTESHYVDDSRVVVCAEVSEPPEYSCNIYIPLNSSEYVIINDTLYLTERENISFPPDKYMSFGDDVAVCADDFMPSADSTDTGNSESIEFIYIAGISFVLSILSLLSLMFTFVTYLLFSELRTVAGYCIMNLTIAQFAALLIFNVGSSWTSNSTVCTVVTMLLHYLFLSIFFWNNVMAFDVWHTFGKGIRNALRRSMLSRSSMPVQKNYLRRIVFRYILYAWGVPLLIVGIAAALEFAVDGVDVGYIYDPEFGFCWISNPTANIIVFGVPVLIILLVNSVFFALAIVAIRKTEKNVTRSGKRLGTLTSVTENASQVDERTDNKVIENNVPEVYDKKRIPSIRSGSSSCNELNGRHSSEEGTDRQESTMKRKRIFSAEIIRGRRNNILTSSKYGKTQIKARTNVLLYIKMSTVMGFSWFLGFAAAFTQITVLWFIFEISVPLQGVSILVAFVCKRRVFRLYRSRFFPNDSKSKIPSQNEAATEPKGNKNKSKMRQSAGDTSDDDVFENDDGIHNESKISSVSELNEDTGGESIPQPQHLSPNTTASDPKNSYSYINHAFSNHKSLG